MSEKTFWRCVVCGDIHYGAAGPKICPTCNSENAYVTVAQGEAKAAMSF